MKVINWVGAAASVVVMAGCGGALAADLSPLYDEPFYVLMPADHPVKVPVTTQYQCVPSVSSCTYLCRCPIA